MSTADHETAETKIPLLSLTAAIVAISVAGAGFGHSLPLFSFLLNAYGASDFTIGMNTGFAAIAALIGAPLFPRVVAKIGLKLFLLISVTIMVVPYLLVFWAGDRIAWWYVLRFIFALGGAGLFAGSEIWINGLAPDHIRGRVIGIYATCLALGFALGPLILNVTGYEGMVPFIAGAAVFGSAALPLLFAKAPAFETDENKGIFGPIKKAPILFGASTMFAGVESAMLIFLPLLALELGHGEGIGAQSLTVYGLGLLVAQIPVGQLADRFNARTVMAACAAIGAIFALMVPVVQESVPLLFAVLFFWGGAVGGIYTAGLVVIGNTYKGPALAVANTGFVFTYALGAVFGPAIAGAVRFGAGPTGLAIAIAGLLAVYAWAARRGARGAA